jgi:hypothetical protein
MTSLSMSTIALAVIFGGTFLGMFVRSRLPEQHLSRDTKDIVMLGTGLIGTIAALVLGLLISTAHETYEAQRTQVKQVIAGVVAMDRALALYGPETGSIRNLLRQNVGILADQIWLEHGAVSGKVDPFVESASVESLYAELLKLSPRDEAHRSLQARAIEAANDAGKARLLLFATAGGSIPMPFLVILISWLTIIFASFSIFANNNATTITAFFIFALSAAAALFLILELSQPFTGLMQISSEPLRNALSPLGSYSGSARSD